MAPGRCLGGQCPSLPGGPAASSWGKKAAAGRSVQSGPVQLSQPRPRPQAHRALLLGAGSRTLQLSHHLPGRKAQLCVGAPCCPPPAPSTEGSAAAGPRCRNGRSCGCAERSFLRGACYAGWQRSGSGPSVPAPGSLATGTAEAWPGHSQGQPRWTPGEATKLHQGHGLKRSKCAHVRCPANPLSAHPCTRTPCARETRGCGEAQGPGLL